MHETFPVIDDNRYGVAGRVAQKSATLALRALIIAALGAFLVTARAVEPFREGGVRERMRRVRLPSFVR